MKKLILLIAILFLSCKGFSQSVTNNVVILDSITANLVVKDLVRLDACQEELFETNKVLKLTEFKVFIKDKMIHNLTEQRSLMEKVVSNKDEVIENKDTIIESLKNVKSNNLFLKIIAIAGLVGTGYFALK